MDLDTDYNQIKHGPQRGGNHLVSVHRLCEARFFKGGKMKVENMTSGNGNKVANQFIITEHGRGALGNFDKRETFQSYDTVIATRTIWSDEVRGKLPAVCIELDANSWDYSTTTGKYRNLFLSETKKETEKKIKSGEYKLVNLNH